MDIILASASPRRSDLLKQIGLDFVVKSSSIKESSVKLCTPNLYVQRLALEKAKDVAQLFKKGLIIGADTIVVKDNRILGKPKNIEDAYNMLKFLSGSEHQVITGIALIDAQKPEKFLTDVEITTVKFRVLDDNEINAYVSSGEPMDKAGAYGIQGLGAVLVEKIIGCYFNVVGLPLTKLSLALKSFGVEVLNV